MANLQRQPPERHFNFVCRNCSKADFLGRRYSCWVCANYHVCGACFDDIRLPEALQHLYYHPLKVHYDRAEYELYFAGEPYSGEDQVVQSYKCALCQENGLSTTDLYRHLLQTHQNEPDHSAYISMVYTHYLAGNTRERLLQCSRTIGPRSDSTRKQRSRNFEAGVVNLAQLREQLEAMDSNATDFPQRCYEILHRAYYLRAQQSTTSMEELAMVENYLGDIESGVANIIAERQLRQGRSFRPTTLSRRGAIWPGSNAASAVEMRLGTPSRTPRAAALLVVPRRPIVTRADGAEPFQRVVNRNCTASRPSVSPPFDQGKTLSVDLGRTVVAVRDRPTLPVKAQGIPLTKKGLSSGNLAFKDSRFLCAKLVRAKSSNAEEWNSKLLKTSFIEAIFCSMLADEELIQLPRSLLWTHLKPMLHQPSDEMKRLYKDFDEYKSWILNHTIQNRGGTSTLTAVRSGWNSISTAYFVDPTDILILKVVSESDGEESGRGEDAYDVPDETDTKNGKGDKKE
ncbi:uncharacterized protein LOC108113453 isoform X2 [Drosophila eugracilis]|uniref:uncharacterized protein LOC108113453 isoform X2 n=1 Tax=Drosophila eugracilis TaxID=29029 RepID=UPI001BDA70E9|nr:uncharacterized protein LOC108113453 isoform X2 [Drosophila eugracilis]